MIDRFSGDYAFLSNYYPSVIVWGHDKEEFPTVEHFFQAMKTWSITQHEAIRTACCPGEAKKLGRRCTLREDWDEVKNDFMLTGLRKKFEDPVLRQKLIDTGNEFLVEGNTWHDTYWGVCEGKGRNMLGTLLMQVREECKKA